MGQYVTIRDSESKKEIVSGKYSGFYFSDLEKACRMIPSKCHPMDYNSEVEFLVNKDEAEELSKLMDVNKYLILNIFKETNAKELIIELDW